MTNAPLRPPDRRQTLAGLQAAIGSVARPNTFVVAWRWRYELTLAAALTTGLIRLSRTPAVGWVLAGCVAVVAMSALWPPARRLAVARAWCVITPHRVRAGCAGAWIHSRGGKLPAVLLTTRQPFGERVRLWCHAGNCAEDFESARKLLVAACWAQDIQVTYNPRHRQLVTLDVIRHPESVPRNPADDEVNRRANGEHCLISGPAQTRARASSVIQLYAPELVDLLASPDKPQPANSAI